ncbi:hypothetical protein [Pseudophaeobacter leonis]|uniref:hypothetical protein n=1 Tax=Pseudophaeobacter leonis TaxID=1144477 RepID=UPI0009F19751|nr:hypothetical protein [Pseudophaeobacter leonis]
MANLTQSELVFAVGELIVEDPKIASKPWDALSLVATFNNNSEKLSGYRYWGESEYEAAEIGNFGDILDKLLELRDAMGDEVDGLWVQCLLQITKPDYAFRVQYEYSDPQRWSPHEMTPTMQEFAASLRPSENAKL